VAIRKIDGVHTVEVSLNHGLAVITFQPENQVGIRRVRDVIRSNGFTPKDAEVRIRGRIVERDAGLALMLPNQNAYRLADHPDTAAVIPRLRQTGLGSVVLVEGRVPAMSRRAGQAETIQVRTFTTARGS
jgi:hypothetical protein